MRHSMNECGKTLCLSDGATQLTTAALPPHSAVRLCLTVNSRKMTGGCASQLRHSLKRKRASVGKAEPFRTVRRPSRTGSWSWGGEKVLRGGADQLRDTWQ